MRKALIAQMPRLLGAKPHHLGGDRSIVGRPAALAARSEAAEDLLAQIAPLRHLKKGLDAGARQRDRIFALAPTSGRLRGRGARQPIRQAGQLVRGFEHESKGILVCEHVLGKLRAERRQPLADLGETDSDVVGKPGACAAERKMVAFQDARLFHVEPERVAPLIEGIDARKERRIEMDLGRVPGQERRHVALDRLDRLARVGAGKVEEDG